MKGLELFAALVGVAAALVFLLAALQALGELMHEWAGERDDEATPPADHPYEPNGGPRGAGPTFPPAGRYAGALHAGPHDIDITINATLPGRRKDSTHDRSAADRSARTN